MRCFQGTTRGDIGSIEEAVEDLFETTKGQLALVIIFTATLIISPGFSRAKSASRILKPLWCGCHTEQFNDDQDSVQ
ncbi:MAG: hypothetical protein IPJ07_18150 [Acidobacteria bacterium]|nr:hypothetical protein [Acidobacteriota bacterium]